MQFVPKLLIFTCNKDPKSWYDWSKCAHPMQALVRRITNEWQYVKQAQPEWGPIPDMPAPSPDGEHPDRWYAFAIRKLGMATFHPANKCMEYIKELPGPSGESLFGFREDPEVGDNVEEEDPDKFFI